ncbi:MAG: hypothetical protein M9894_27370 [Planctomycetes bacterium]|nr:hypothetical protein [Planctomycetota bacterium]MCO5170072.1 hypothetical protein [Planctomycetota bacterium]MCW8137666.1 hypothetical protein [Planctomycetota bacterium]
MSDSTVDLELELELERSPAERLLEQLALDRTEGLDPAPPPTPLARLAARCLLRLEPHWQWILSFEAATRDLPSGAARGDAGRNLVPRWALLARGLAITATYYTADTPGAPVALGLPERLDAARAAIALAARVSSDDPHGFVAIAGLPRVLERLGEVEELPTSVRRAAHQVAAGLLQAGDRGEERALLAVLLPEADLDSSARRSLRACTEKTGASVDASRDVSRAGQQESAPKTRVPQGPEGTVERDSTEGCARAEATAFREPPSPASSALMITCVEESRLVLVDGKQVPELKPLARVEAKLLIAILQSGGLISAKTLAHPLKESDATLRSTYSKLSRRLEFEGKSILTREQPGVYRLAPGFVSGQAARPQPSASNPI